MITDQDRAVVDDETLAGIVTFVWETLTQGGVEADEAVTVVDGPAATISIGGPWTATLEVIVSPILARRFAADLLQVGDAELSEDDVHDALGELVNVVGGNVKGLVDERRDATLSLPVVAATCPSVTGGHRTVACGFAVAGEPMVWALYERA